MRRDLFIVFVRCAIFGEIGQLLASVEIPAQDAGSQNSRNL